MTSTSTASPLSRWTSRSRLETIASGDAVRRVLRSSHGDVLTMRRIATLADAGDPAVVEAVSRSGRAVGQCLAALCSSLDVDAIVVGGDLGAGCQLVRA